MAVGIIGGRSTGKTVFVSLLATTAINYTVETKQHFRYYATPEFTTVIQDIIASLKLRRWPPATLKGSLVEYKFWFGYSKKLSGILNPLYDKLEELSASIKRLEIPRRELYNIIEFGLYDLAGEDVDIIFRAASLAKERGASVIEMLSENLKAVLDCDVLVFLIDSSKVTTDNTDPRYKEMLDYDGLMASLMSLVAMYRSKKYGIKAGKLFPVFVFTKFDTVDRKVLNAIGISENIDRWLIEKRKERKEIAERLTGFMKRFYQHTLALVYGGTLMGVELERAEVFVSYLMPELSEEGIPVPKVVKAPDGVSYDLVYSRSEYYRFIDYFGKIANEIKKTHKEPTAPVTRLGR
jgi:hypothetical protein